jgi:hypothetical protein
MMEYIIHNLFSTEAGVVWLVLKWILVVLAAGFIGQFGKAFATYLMRRTRQPMEPFPQSLPEANSKGAMPESPALQPIPSAGQEEEKREMKVQTKQQTKQQKKALKSLKKFFK